MIDATSPPRVRVRDIIQAASAASGVSVIDIVSRRRHGKLVYVRQLIMALARELTIASVCDIGRLMNRDHSTVLHGMRRHVERRSMDPAVQRLEATVRDMLEHDLATIAAQPSVSADDPPVNADNAPVKGPGQYRQPDGVPAEQRKWFDDNDARFRAHLATLDPAHYSTGGRTCMTAST